MAAAVIDVSDGPSKGLLSRLRTQKRLLASSSSATSAGVEVTPADFRTVLERAARGDMSLRKARLAHNKEFAVLHWKHKAVACHTLAHGARYGTLTTVHLDGLQLDVGCAEALAELLSAPRLLVLTLTSNCLNEAAVRQLACAMGGHPALSELALADQSRGPLSTRAITDLLDAMESVPTLVKLRNQQQQRQNPHGASHRVPPMAPPNALEL